MVQQDRETLLFSMLDILVIVGNGMLSELDPQHSTDLSNLVTYSMEQSPS
jgi:hypothetical protein